MRTSVRFYTAGSSTALVRESKPPAVKPVAGGHRSQAQQWASVLLGAFAPHYFEQLLLTIFSCVTVM
jgi:hypothetical protein